MKKNIFSSSQEETGNIVDEYSIGREICAPAEEYSMAPEYPVSDKEKEYMAFHAGVIDKKEDENVKSHIRKSMMFIKTAAVLGTIMVVFASYGIDYIKKLYDIPQKLENETESTSSESSPHTEDKDPDTEKADGMFPALKNLEPNGVTDTPFGVLDEEFICITHPSTNESEFILINSADTYHSVTSIDGISYDKASNTLTLDNYSGDRLVANLMGNGFKLHLIGDNSLQQILIWGFYYGGSLTITGDGSLTVNEASAESFGIFFEAESSQTCLMIDKNVSLDIYGTTSAVFVKETTMEKSIYYLSPQVLTGGVRKSEKENQLFHGYIEDENGELSKHVTFRPKE